MPGKLFLLDLADTRRFDIFTFANTFQPHGRFLISQRYVLVWDLRNSVELGLFGVMVHNQIDDSESPLFKSRS